VRKFTYQQTHAQSCGAACLMVAAKELGVTSLPKDINYGWGAGHDFSAGFTVAVENALYATTSNWQFAYSMPAFVGKAARRMGLDVTVHMSGCCIPPLLQCLYPQAVAQCAQLNIDVEQGGYGQLAENERALCVVGIGGGLFGLHYVLHRPDGSYMDPATNANYNWFIAMGQGCGNMLKYLDTGISVVVRLEEVALPNWF